MAEWRVIETDTETLSGIGPVCPDQHAELKHHDRKWDKSFLVRFDDHGTYDCCPGPHLECWSQRIAAQVVALLNQAEAEVLLR